MADREGLAISETDENVKSKPLCKYGRQCYRKNPAHFLEFTHPWQDKEEVEGGRDGEVTGRDSETLGPPISKKPRLEVRDEDEPCHSKSLTEAHTDTSTPPQESPPSSSAKPLFYLTKVRGIGNYHNRAELAVGIRDILSPSMGDLVASAQFNYMFDVPWLMQQYPTDKRGCPLLLVHGEQREGLMRLRSEAAPFPNIKPLQAKLEIMFGTHHSKMMLLAYRSGLRVVIHTANLIPKDWDLKTQGVWISPVFSKIDSSSDHTQSGSRLKDTCFKKDLLDYLNAYGESAGRSGLNEWKQRIQEHDLSTARVRLIASVPGAHTGLNMYKWGHMKLRKVLVEHGPVHSEVDTHWPVVGQFSSIGSLGPSSQQWLCSEWLHSLSTARREGGGKAVPLSQVKKYPSLQLVFPSVDNVRNSYEGYMAGGSIPYATKTATNQPYLTDYMCQWKASQTGRSRAAPHIKTYMRVSPDCTHLAWFLVTSANLSKAAWGAMEKKGSQLKIRSYEIGVLFLPTDQETPQKLLRVAGSQDADDASDMCIQVPIDLPLTGYSKNDKPWIWNMKYLEPDCNGRLWTPGS